MQLLGVEVGEKMMRLFSDSIMLAPSSLFLASSCTASRSSSPSWAGAQEEDPQELLNLKLVAIAAILIFGGGGVWLPLAGKKHRQRVGEGNRSLAFGAMRSFAAGVVLATGFVHMLHGSEHALSNTCLPEFPWRIFPFPGFIAMAAALLTLVVDCVGTQFFVNKHRSDSVSHGLLLDTRNANPYGHGHGHSPHAELSSEIQSTVVSQILELGIVSHSVIIGLSLGVSRSASTIRPLVAALSFHQFFEGFALGGCISQANFDGCKTLVMATFFAITTPSGIGVGVAVSSFYNPSSPGALIVEGILDALSAGILIYMALVDLIAADFLSGKFASRPTMQLVSFISLFIGALAMSLLAIWA